MTQPIQEPILPRRLGSLGYGQDQLFRRPARPSADGANAWMAMDNFLNGTESDGSSMEVDWDRLWISDNGGDYFTYEIDAGGGQFGQDKIIGKILESGVYTYTYQLYTDDLPFTPAQRFYFQSNCYVNTDAGAADVAFPGSHISNGPLRIVRQYDVESAGGADVDVQGSWTIPVHVTPQSGGSTTGRVTFQYSDGSAEIWIVNCWIVRHSDLSWSDNDFQTPTVTG